MLSASQATTAVLPLVLLPTGSIHRRRGSYLERRRAMPGRWLACGRGSREHACAAGAHGSLASFIESLRFRIPSRPGSSSHERVHNWLHAKRDSCVTLNYWHHQATDSISICCTIHPWEVRGSDDWPRSFPSFPRSDSESLSPAARPRANTQRRYCGQ